MVEKEEQYMVYDDLEMVSLRLGSLINMINTIHNGLKSEGMEKQSVDCMECICFCIDGLKNIIDNCLEQLAEKSKHIEEK